MYGADPTEKHPMKGFPQICFIRNTVSNPNITIGAIAWWNWEIGKITRNLDKIVAADIQALRHCE
jgi:hypothetical protein